MKKLPGIIIIFLVASFGGYSWYQSGIEAAVTVKTPTKSGLVGYWSFEEATGTTVTDFSGNGNRGTTTNMSNPATATSGWGSGKLGSGLNFDGVNDYASIASINNSGTNVLSVSFWLKQNSFTNFDSLAIEATTNNNLFTTGVSIDPNSSNPCLGLVQVNIRGNVGYDIACYTRPSAGEWNHYVFIGDKGQLGGNEVNLYINGVLQTPTSRPIVNNNTNNFGNDPWYFMSRGGASLFNAGKLDEVRIYNRALSQDEITKLYQSGAEKLNVSQNTKLTDGLVGMWSFNGADMNGTTAYDRSGQNNNGTLTNSPPKTIGKIGQALNFDGVNDYVSIPDIDAIDFAYNQDFSISAWIKIPVIQANVGAVDNSIIEKWNNSGPYPYVVRVYNSTAGGNANKLRFARYDGTNNPGINSTLTYNDNVWHHIIANKNGSSLGLYIDGVLVGTTLDTTVSTTTNTSPLCLGMRCTNAKNFSGQVDEVRIYNRALSQDEITKLYQSGAEKLNVSQNTKLTDGLVGMWSFNGADMSSTTAYDRSGQGNNGTLTNGPTKTIGKIGQALNFDGTDDYVSVNDSSGGFTFPNTTFTVSSWIKTSDVSNSVFISDGGCSSGVAKGWCVRTSSGQIQGNIKSTSGGSNAALRNSSLVINDNKWHHSVVIFTTDTTVGSNNNIQIYIDGALNQGSLSGGLVYGIQSDFLYLGKRTEGNYFPGKIDEVRIYNRALSATEVTQLYNLGR